MDWKLHVKGRTASSETQGMGFSIRDKKPSLESDWNVNFRWKGVGGYMYLAGVSDKISGLGQVMCGEAELASFPACRTAPLSPFRQSSTSELASLSRLEPALSSSMVANGRGKQDPSLAHSRSGPDVDTRTPPAIDTPLYCPWSHPT